jgi:hypothetical protein
MYRAASRKHCYDETLGIKTPDPTTNNAFTRSRTESTKLQPMSVYSPPVYQGKSTAHCEPVRKFILELTFLVYGDRYSTM